MMSTSQVYPVGNAGHWVLFRVFPGETFHFTLRKANYSKSISQTFIEEIKAYTFLSDSEIYDAEYVAR